MQRLLKKYIRLVFENEENKSRKTFKDILASFTPIEKKTDQTNSNQNNDPIEQNTDQISYDYLIKKAKQAKQAEQAKKNKKASQTR